MRSDDYNDDDNYDADDNDDYHDHDYDDDDDSNHGDDKINVPLFLFIALRPHSQVDRISVAYNCWYRRSSKNHNVLMYCSNNYRTMVPDGFS